MKYENKTHETRSQSTLTSGQRTASASGILYGEKYRRRRLRAFAMLATDQRGLNTVELVVIIAVVIALALLFRSRITEFVTTLLDGLFSDKTAAELVRGVSVP